MILDIRCLFVFYHVFKQLHIRLIDMDGKCNSICCVDERASRTWWACKPTSHQKQQTCCHNVASKHAASNESGVVYLLRPLFENIYKRRLTHRGFWSWEANRWEKKCAENEKAIEKEIQRDTKRVKESSVCLIGDKRTNVWDAIQQRLKMKTILMVSTCFLWFAWREK